MEAKQAMSIFLNILCICLGGALGAITRAQIASRFDNTKTGFPLGTFIANMMASFLLGIIILIMQKASLPNYVDLFLEVGFCATLSTFSSLAWQIANMLQHQKFLLALTYTLSTILGGLILFEIAIHLA